MATDNSPAESGRGRNRPSRTAPAGIASIGRPLTAGVIRPLTAAHLAGLSPSLTRQPAPRSSPRQSCLYPPDLAVYSPLKEVSG